MGDDNRCQSASRSDELIDFVIVSVLGLVLALVYLPVVTWLGRLTVELEQLHNAGLIVLIALLIGLRQAVRERPLRLAASSLGIVLILIGLGILALLKIWPVFPLPMVLVSFCLSFAGMTGLILGTRGIGALLPAIVGILLLGVFAGLAPTLDWPLRALAARSSAALLNTLGFDVTVALQVGQPPHLLLAVDQRVFVVASECNGFGLLLSCLLVAAILVFYHRLSWPRRVFILILAVPTAILFNSLRIVGICAAAGRVPLPYMVIHEGIGAVSYLLALGLLWWLTRRAAPACSDSFL